MTRNVLFTVFAALLSVIAFGQTTQSSDSIILLIDPLKLSHEIDRAKVYSALAELAVNKNHTEFFKVKPKYGYYDVIRDRYRYNDGEYKATADAIFESIKNSTHTEVLQENQELAVPTLPVKPRNDSSPFFSQHLDVYRNTSYVSPISNTLAGKPLVTNVDPSQAKYISYKLTKADYIEFKKNVGAAVLFNNTDAFSTVAEPEVVKIGFPSITDSTSKAFELETDSAIINTVRSIDYKYYGKIVVLDFFGNCDAHGEKVLDVMRIVLNKYGIPGVQQNIIPRSISYFNNEELSLKTIEDYYTKTIGLENSTAKEEIKKLKELRLANRKYCVACNCGSNCSCDDCIPVILLRALLNYYYDNLTASDIISTSIYANVSFAIGGVMSRYRDTGPVLVTAALDSENKTVESLTDVSSGIDAIEPLYSYYMSYSRTGNVIVGAKTGTNEYFGMYSADGAGVTTLGQGSGWNNTCIKRNNKGTSFSTPEISISLLVANAFWRSKNLKIDAKESRTRILLASDVNPSFVGKFGSGGNINLRKLLSTSGYVQFKTGEIKEATILSGSTLKFGEVSGAQFRRKSVSSNSNDNEICGLALIGDRIFLFDEGHNSWVEKENTEVNLKIDIGGKVYNYPSMNSLKSDIIQVVSLK